MRLFRLNTQVRSEAAQKLYARFEIAYTFVDFGAALCFIIGSILFFFDWAQVPAIWFFLIGSFLFAAKPTLRLMREIKLYRMGDMPDLARKLEE